MPTQVLLTTDTELSSSLHAEGLSARQNYLRSIEGRCWRGRRWGIGYQLDELDRWGLKTVFFVDPMPALVYGPQIVADMVGPILERGHEVQLHIHTEWLDHVTDSPVGGRTGRNIGDFSLSDQIILLGLARDLLVAAGAPPPTAFRAGNYGANDDTLRALAAIGIDWDSSFNAAHLDGDCNIGLDPHVHHVTQYEGVQLLPISVIEDRPGILRHAQLCALSSLEMKRALLHAADRGAHFYTVVNHSFEMFVRGASRGHPLVARRYRSLCRTIARDDRLVSGGFERLARRGRHRGAPPLPASPPRRALRLAEQVGARLLIEERIDYPPLG
ncbi:polysaccharide deacetylase family protein [Novosphingopyxis iocasae]|uniref:polysaccharide deacetylase family protein n=1 Tax=Novosphingopyxis iocasae TaxID=2762729 RepID=UPI001650ED42|nr:hypothetical protein [Novosphingopyxis iocasae]